MSKTKYEKVPRVSLNYQAKQIARLEDELRREREFSSHKHCIQVAGNPNNGYFLFSTCAWYFNWGANKRIATILHGREKATRKDLKAIIECAKDQMKKIPRKCCRCCK